MKIIVGLGNPGEKYLMTRHNAGYLALDYLVSEIEKEGITLNWKEEAKLKALTCRLTMGKEIYFLVKPLTYMNLSGETVSAVLNFFKEPKENLVVIYDDVDLPLGKVRIRNKGSAGTHNGMRSIIQQLGSDEFKRIRIGIESRGESAPEQQDLHSFVLNNFTEEEKEKLITVLKEVVQEIKST